VLTLAPFFGDKMRASLFSTSGTIFGTRNFSDGSSFGFSSSFDEGGARFSFSAFSWSIAIFFIGEFRASIFRKEM